MQALDQLSLRWLDQMSLRWDVTTEDYSKSAQHHLSRREGYSAVDPRQMRAEIRRRIELTKPTRLRGCLYEQPQADKARNDDEHTTDLRSHGPFFPLFPLQKLCRTLFREAVRKGRPKRLPNHLLRKIERVRVMFCDSAVRQNETWLYSHTRSRTRFF